MATINLLDLLFLSSDPLSLLASLSTSVSASKNIRQRLTFLRRLGGADSIYFNARNYRRLTSCAKVAMANLLALVYFNRMCLRDGKIMPCEGSSYLARRAVTWVALAYKLAQKQAARASRTIWSDNFPHSFKSRHSVARKPFELLLRADRNEA